MKRSFNKILLYVSFAFLIWGNKNDLCAADLIFLLDHFCPTS